MNTTASRTAKKQPMKTTESLRMTRVESSEAFLRITLNRKGIKIAGISRALNITHRVMRVKEQLMTLRIEERCHGHS
jgi:hypothetical protein